MCGIFGVVVKPGANYSTRFLKKTLITLSKLSESRGKDSSGLCLFNQESQKIDIVKGPVRISNLLKNQETIQAIDSAFSSNVSDSINYAFGHARLVTNGTQLNDENNQPVVKDGVVGIHNGIIVNVNDLWNTNECINRSYEIDTEVLLAMIKSELEKDRSLENSVSYGFNKILGTISTAIVFNNLNKFILATNNGSLYILYNNKDILFFASERVMLSKFESRFNLNKIIGNYTSVQLMPDTAYSIDLERFDLEPFTLNGNLKSKKNTEVFNSKVPITIKELPPDKKQISTVFDINEIHNTVYAKNEKALFLYPIDDIKKLKRCSKCILPETFPFIEFDEQGVCNYCNNFKKKNQPKPLEELEKLVEPYRRVNGSPDVLIPFSGGRDSTYVLHIVKEVLGLNPIAFTYDWGMVTDLARRNIASICGKLGIENIIVAADIHWKRKNIKKNIIAWLKQPALGMIPLFMAGDKFFFYYANKVKKENNIRLNIWGINELENTNFKTGFAGLKPEFDKERIYSLSLYNKLKLFGFIGKNILQSPGYLNQSNLDSVGSFISRYSTQKTDYFHLFDYMQWDEKLIENTIINHYNWETAIDTESTWRIGDGTASFYNYIYTTVAGFSENDTFRSNQIREGMITRNEALNKIYEENKPRYNSLKWYLEIIGLDFEETIKAINKIARLYS
ncbi:MAG: hypothetical protein K8S18_10210 [Desulfobacula sp.]|nr:hypothetical protein [Desulfobacula sp.]